MAMDEIIESKLTLMQYIDKTPKTAMKFNNNDVINVSDDFPGLRASLIPVVSRVEDCHWFWFSCVTVPIR